jgi:2-keto-4-pentenoate hydratase
LTEPAATTEAAPEAEAIARRLVAARRAAQALERYPGQPPQGLAAAYQIQEIAIGLWPDAVAGWKIGKVPPEAQAQAGASRLVGPIFARHVALGEDGAFPVVEGGFAAVEAEVIFRIGQDAPPDKTNWTPAEAEALAGDLHIGLEAAGSPLAGINDLGPAVVVSDFGNNAGLIVGPAIPGWRARAPESLACAALINGAVVGTGSAANLEGGPAACLAFLLGHAAARGRPLKAGMWVSTGQLTGIHEVRAGDEAVVDFGPLGQVRCRPAPARPDT